MKKNIFLAVFLIIIVTVINFFGDSIFYNYQIYKFRDNYKDLSSNEYKNNYSFNYVSNNTLLELNNKQDIINTIYTLLNSGSTNIKRYCSKEYVDCEDDINNIANDENLLSYVNSFAHPYNSFYNITFSYDSYLRLDINYTKIYTNDEINLINDKMNDIIKNNMNDKMTNREKIKTFHDYVIKNTSYDTLKKTDINDNTHRSNTAYGVLFEGYGICSGYSDTMAIFLNILNIPNYKISTDTHIWNLVYIDNEWLHIDLTWDDPVYENSNVTTISYNYFLITTEQLKKLNDNQHIFNTNIYSEAK